MAAAAAQEADEPWRPPAPALKKSAPGQPWSHMETMHLIDVYEERWTKLRRGQLKAQQWEDVAAEVTARCGGSGGGGAQRKTGTQCRHKLEKLRKRYRTESARPVTSLWPFFRRMERLERGPLPVNAFPPNAFPRPADAAAAVSDEEEDEEEEEEEEEDEEQQEQELLPRNNTRSINGILRECGGFRGLAPHQPPPPQQRPPPPPAMMLSTAPPRKRVAYEAFQSKPVADRVKVEEAQVGRSGEGVNGQFSGLLKDFGEGIMRLERRRMEVQWEIEREWKEAEARHTKLLLDAQRQFQDTLATASAAQAAAPGKKARRDHGSSADGL